MVTVCYNSAQTLERTILGVIGQTYSNVEYIIIDGGSTDGTLDIIENYADRISFWCSEPDDGIYDAMNKGIARATGEWIHLLNSDDIYADAAALANIVGLLDPARTNYFSMILEKTDGSRELLEFPFAKWKLYVSAFLPHPGLVVSREQYARVGLYETKYRIAADHDFILRMLRAYPAKFEPAPFVVMRQGGRSSQNLLQTCREFMKVTIDHGLPTWLATVIYLTKRVHWRI